MRHNYKLWIFLLQHLNDVRQINGQSIVSFDAMICIARSCRAAYHDVACEVDMNPQHIG